MITLPPGGPSVEMTAEQALTHKYNISAPSAGHKLAPGGVVFVDFYDVLHQQVPLQAGHSVSVQRHLLEAGGTADTPLRGHGGGATGLPQGIGCLRREREGKGGRGLGGRGGKRVINEQTEKHTLEASPAVFTSSKM